MDCDRCGNGIQDGQEKKICLAGVERNYNFTLCSSCGDLIWDAARVNLLGRNIGTGDLQEMARRMPEKGVDHPLNPRREPASFFREIQFDEGRHYTGWLKRHGHLARDQAQENDAE